MERLTIMDERIPGGTRRKVISVKAVKEEAMTLYWQLKKYEDTGLMPDQIQELDRLYLEKCQEVTELKKQKEWIPVKERLPEKPKENPLYDNKPLETYLVSVKNTGCVIIALWNGASFTDGWEKLDVLAWMPLPEPYKEAEE
ncbi:DUF551 domain-containing protein [Enterocloster clostridioformis]|uniref:DUF551 domain-containing protein n=1 Tax=Enterocloster clostridioformis TaxID=1531 RepID=UPI001FADC1D4|nr:DUF551 domain-containing protein [Enterocloster clostridioformis]MDB2128463.1 DUF551 domain-containing protein [Enterocloster clostridioformis]